MTTVPIHPTHVPGPRRICRGCGTKLRPGSPLVSKPCIAQMSFDDVGAVGASYVQTPLPEQRERSVLVLDANDRRGPRALELALRSHDWTPRGRAYNVPSTTDPRRVYHVTRDWCSCADFRYRGAERVCSHVLAVTLIDTLADERSAF